MSDIALLKIHDADYYSIINGISKNDVIHLWHRSTEESRTLYIKKLLSYIKMGK